MTIGGFPNRTSRRAFGPPLDQWGPVRNPKKEIGRDTFELAWALVAASSQSGPLAQLLISSAGDILARTEAWNPDGDPAMTVPTVTLGAAGVYTVAYPAQAPDRDGVLRTLGFLAAKVSVQTTSDLRAVGVVTASSTVQATIRTSLGGGASAKFFLEIW